MALISKIRERMGWAVGFVAVGLGLFVIGGDLMSANSRIMGGSAQNAGTIAGKDIKIDEYRQRVEMMKSNYYLQTGNVPTEDMMPSLRDQAWNELIYEIAFGKEYEMAGLTVSDEEVWDMLQGQNISPVIKQSFVNQETGEFDRNMVINYLQNIDKMEPRQQVMWKNFEDALPKERLREKFNLLLSLSINASGEEAKRLYNNQNEKVDAEYLFVPYYSIPDSTVNVTDADLKDYLQRNKAKFETDAYISVDYVTFPVAPSGKDSSALAEEIAYIKNDFQNADNDSVFVSRYSDSPEAIASYSPGDLPAELLNLAGGSPAKGEVYGPLLDYSGYSLYKVTNVGDDSVYSAKASHILFNLDEGKEEALKKAKDVLAQIKGGANFSIMAAIHGTDGTKERGGDLGWFTEGQMVPAFNDAVFSFNGTGLLPQPVETSFGYHIIQVTGAKTKTKYTVSKITRAITAGEETRDSVFNMAAAFAAANRSAEALNKAVEENPVINKMSAKQIKREANSVNNLQKAGELVRWAFDNAKVNEVSDVFELDNQYVVAVLTDKADKGLPNIESVRDQITGAVRNELKGKQIVEKLSDKNKSFTELAKAFENTARTGTATEINLASSSVQGIGFEPVMCGTVMGLPEGKRSSPVAGESGVAIFEVKKRTPATEIADYSVYKNQITNPVKSRVSNMAEKAIKDNLGVEDLRYKFF